MKTLVINRTKDTGRFSFQSEQLERLEMDFERIIATEVDTLTEEQKTNFQNNWQRPLRLTEIACTMSHQQCWKRVIEINQACLIIEDYALMCESLNELLSKLNSQKDYNIISLETRGRKKFISKQSTPLNANYRIHSMLYDKGGAAGYILWPSAAKALVKHIEEVGVSPADALIGECKGLKRGQVNPAPILQLDMCDLYEIATPSCSQSIIFTNNPRPKAHGLVHKIRFKMKRISAQLSIFIRIHVWGRLAGKHTVSLVPILKKEFEAAAPIN